jgi:hypothetical protein
LDSAAWQHPSAQCAIGSAVSGPKTKQVPTHNHASYSPGLTLCVFPLS